jgi:hypothetical protein
MLALQARSPEFELQSHKKQTKKEYKATLRAGHCGSYYTSIISALERLRQEDPKFEASLGYISGDFVSK